MSSRVVVPVVIWLLSIVGGFGYLSFHAAAPGLGAGAPPTWPAAAALTRRAERDALVVVLHPECPCSRATVAELARLMARVGDRVDVHVLFVRPAGLARDPADSPLWKSVAAIPNVDLRVDNGGVIAARFGAVTSGQVLLYDVKGSLLFAGGITSSRGHEGDNDGLDTLEGAIRGASGHATASVFGCSLFGEKR